MPISIALLRRRYSPTGGAENYLERLAAAVQSRGHDVTLWCEQWDYPRTAVQTIQSVPTSGPDAFARAIQAQRLTERYDVVFSFERVPGCDLYRAGDGVHAEWMRARAAYSPVLGPVRNWMRSKNRDVCRLERAVFDPAATRGIIANSRKVLREISRGFNFPEEHISVVYNGVAYEKFSSGNREAGRRALGLAAEDFAVLLVGAGAERKGVRYAQAAVARCGVPRARFVLIDRPAPAPLADVYAAADVFLLPTLYDPFANVTLEALAAGLPVLTTVHNGAAEILTPGRDGFVIQRANDVDAMVAWLRQMADPAARAAIKAPAQALARQFSLDRNVEETLTACEKLARRSE